MKRLIPIVLGVLCLAVVSVQAEPKKKGAPRPAARNEEQKKLMKELREKYDANKDGKLSPEERRSISAEDKARIEKVGLGARKGKNREK